MTSIAVSRNPARTGGSRYWPKKVQLLHKVFRIDELYYVLRGQWTSLSQGISNCEMNCLRSPRPSHRRSPFRKIAQMRDGVGRVTSPSRNGTGYNQLIGSLHRWSPIDPNRASDRPTSAASSAGLRRSRRIHTRSRSFRGQWGDSALSREVEDSKKSCRNRIQRRPMPLRV